MLWMPGRKNKVVTGAEVNANRLSHFMEELEFTPMNPTRKFNVGDRVSFGTWEESYVEEVIEDGLGYGIRSSKVVHKELWEGGDKVVQAYNYAQWMFVYPYGVAARDKNFTINEDLRLHFTNTDIESLLHYVYKFGVNFDPVYQRGDVWDDKDRESLLDSIFMGADIGKFLFAERDWHIDGRSYDVVDGRQRLKTLCAFFEDRFQYRGCYYSELSGRDKRTFKQHGALKATISNAPQDTIIRYFLMLNRGGKPMDEDWLKHVEGMLEES